ncbi:MAG: LptF/LptG family permease [bacterium]
MKILDRYLVREFLFSFFAVLLVCLVVMVIQELFETFGKILRNEPPLGAVCLYFIYTMPGDVVEVAPVAAILGALFAIGGMARHNEVTAMMASGISTLRVALPIALTGTVLSVGMFVFNEIVVPDSTSKAERIYLVEIKAKGDSVLTRSKDIFVKGAGRRFYMMEGFDTKGNEMEKPTVYVQTENASFIERRIDAQRAVLEPKAGGNGRGEWVFYGATVWNFDKDGFVKSMKSYVEPLRLEMETDLEKFLSHRKKPEAMNYFELRDYVEILNARDETAYDLRTDLASKISFPFAVLVLTMIGLSFAVTAEARTYVLGFGLGFLVAVLYYGANAFFVQGVGYRGWLPAVVAAWIPNVVFLGLGVYRLYRMNFFAKQ